MQDRTDVHRTYKYLFFEKMQYLVVGLINKQ